MLTHSRPWLRTGCTLLAMLAPYTAGMAADTEPPEGLSANAPAIHQERDLTAGCDRVYRALTHAHEFEALTRLSDAADLLSAPNAQLTAIGARAGDPFTLFGGYITGRNLELLPGKRLVQAWRTRSWPDGEYSVVRFELSSQGGGCRIVFDQRGFPASQGASLAYGWRVHYWEPLAKFLATP